MPGFHANGTTPLAYLSSFAQGQVYQSGLEAATQSVANADVYQSGLEAATQSVANADVYQSGLEVLAQPPRAIVYQAGTELAAQFNSDILVYQSGIELLYYRSGPQPTPPVPPIPLPSVIDTANTIFIDFLPSAVSPFQFQATLDGTTYTVIVTWNVWGQRYYVNIYTLSGILVLTIPMVGSPLSYNLSLTAGYFNTLLVWRVENNQFEIITPVTS